MTVFQITALLVVLAGLFGTINHLFLRLPATIGILVVALMASLCLLAVDLALPGIDAAIGMRGLVLSFEFSDALLEGALGLLLFAGALHVKTADLRAQWAPVLLMATLGVAISTVVIGTAFSWITGLPILVALVFGAIISPTDPVAVLGVLRKAELPRAIETEIAGESLFNDGVGYVAFLILVGLAFPGTAVHGADHSAPLMLFLREVLGGAAIGLGLGWLVLQLLRRVDDPVLEVLLTLGLAMGGYELASAVGVSAPIMAVLAGLCVGNAPRTHWADGHPGALDAFWRMADQILNAVLFLVIGLEVFAVTLQLDILLASILAIGLSLIGRFAAVAIPLLILRPFRRIERGTLPVMTWGGLKGGISVALALSLPDSPATPLLLTATYVVVVFSIIVQGLTVGRLAARVTAPEEPAP